MPARRARIVLVTSLLAAIVLTGCLSSRTAPHESRQPPEFRCHSPVASLEDIGGLEQVSSIALDRLVGVYRNGDGFNGILVHLEPGGSLRWINYGCMYRDQYAGRWQFADGRIDLALPELSDTVVGADSVPWVTEQMIRDLKYGPLADSVLYPYLYEGRVTLIGPSMEREIMECGIRLHTALLKEEDGI